MSKTNSKHYELCCLGAKWVKKTDWGRYKYIAVELVSAAAENPDIWGTDGNKSILVEIKTSLSDFKADQKKYSRLHPEFATGNLRYYLCPKGLITPEILPPMWGLLYEDDGVITVEVEAELQQVQNFAEMPFLCSIMRREGIKAGIFNYRKPKDNEK